MIKHRWDYNTVAYWLTKLRDHCHSEAINAGWWDDQFWNFGEKLALCHSELSEALEGHRKDLMDDHLTDRKMVEVELADTIIRIMDLCGKLDLDIGGAVIDKINYNRHRQDHKRENRSKKGGKKY